MILLINLIILNYCLKYRNDGSEFRCIIIIDSDFEFFFYTFMRIYKIYYFQSFREFLYWINYVFTEQINL